MTIFISIQSKGGPGSGNWGHRGIPGKVGGSSTRGAGMSPTSGKDWLQRYEKKTGKKHPSAEKKPEPTGAIITRTLANINSAAEKVTNVPQAQDVIDVADKIRIHIQDNPAGAEQWVSDDLDKVRKLMDTGEYVKIVQAKDKMYAILDAIRSSTKLETADAHEKLDDISQASAFLNTTTNVADWENASKREREMAKSDIVYRLSEMSGIPEDDVNKVIHGWAQTSNDESPSALSMQEAVSDTFGVPLSKWQEGSIAEIGGHTRGHISREAEERFINAMYANTQDELDKAGYGFGSKITLYRGIMIEGGGDTRRTGDVSNYMGNAMESWSISQSIADLFAISDPKMGVKGVVVSMEVPIENILGTAATGFGCLTEGEFVILGSMGDSQVTVVSAS